MSEIVMSFCQPDQKEVWVYGSTLMPPEWRAWECIAATKEGLAAKCIKDYKRVPYDCIPLQVPLMRIPSPHFENYCRSIFSGEEA
jgi:hypothetical protein